MADKTWLIKEQVPSAIADKFVEVHPMLVQLMWNRGIQDQAGLDQFLNPDYGDDIHDPFLFSRMQDVVDRILKALEGDDLIMIHGDYDGDGICGTAVMLSALREVCERGGFTAFDEGRVQWYLPDREGDGYGMSYGAIEEFKDKKVNLIITVDCGIANTDEIAKAYEYGMEVIVVDHHQMPDVLSDKAMLIHPLVPGEKYPFKKLAAVGVAFKVACGLYKHARDRGIDMPEGLEKWLLDLVAIATVTDMVPLIGENRTLEKYGLVVMNKTKRTGLLALMEAAGIEPGKLNTTDIGFKIGPRINAAGRIAHAGEALKVILEEGPVAAKHLASRLNEINKERQKLARDATRVAMAKIEGDEKRFIAVVDKSIRIGIAGLVAGKIVNETGLPSVVMTKVGENYVGSGRGPDGFHFIEAMDTCREHMITGGGHPQACGFRLDESSIPTWVDAMNAHAVKTLDPERGPELHIDSELDLALADWELVDLVQKMEPYGVGNEMPKFVSRKLQVVAAEAIGKTKTHLRLTVATEDRVMRQCIGFGYGKWSDRLTLGDMVDLVYEVGVNEWNGNRELQLQIKDIKKV
ncbi:MAG TPA: single-stranded-DNA-specific exonuclease RecJ [Patescibacteria group bacterium]|nr:single-stranded-DNA-specific exonuclease RecJ [Patescibacteria group bacterium]